MTFRARPLKNAILGCWVFSPKIVSFYIDHPVSTPLAIQYIEVLFVGFLFSAYSIVFQGFFTGIEKTKVHLVVTLLSNLLNIYLNAALIYGSAGIIVFFDTVFEDISFKRLAFHELFHAYQFHYADASSIGALQVDGPWLIEGGAELFSEIILCQLGYQTEEKFNSQMKLKLLSKEEYLSGNIPSVSYTHLTLPTNREV